MKKIYSAFICGLVLFAGAAFSQPNNAGARTERKLYTKMGFDEKAQFIARESEKVLAAFGRTEEDTIGAEGRTAIRNYVDSLARKLALPKSESCAGNVWGQSDLESILTRGSRVAPLISAEFKAANLPPQLGIYTAFVESSFCACIQSPTGALGMFQLVASTGRRYGLKTKTGSNAAGPDERCEPKPAARAAAKLYREMIDQTFGADAVGIPLAISSYNRGVGMTKRHILDASEITEGRRINFWTLMETRHELREKLGGSDDENSRATRYLEQFEAENIKYVPMFFAAVIVGENPEVFGVDLPPLSGVK